MIGRKARTHASEGTRHRAGRPVPGMLGAGLIGGLALASGLALTATSGWLIVAASLRPQILTLLAAIVLVRAFGIARPVLRYAERVRSHDRALAWLARERAAVYARLIPLTPARLGRRARGQVLAGVVDDLDDLAYAQVRVVVPLVALLVTGAIAVGLDAVVLPAAAVVAASTVGCCLVVGLIDWWLERRALPAMLAARGRLSHVSALVATNAAELAAIGAAGQACAWVDAAQADLVAATRRQRWGRAFGTAAVPLVVAGHTAWMALLVAPLVSDSLVSPLPTPLAALLVLTPVALGEVVAAVPDAVGSLARSQAAAARLDALLDQRPAVTHPRVDDDDTDPGSDGSGVQLREDGTPVPTDVPRLALDRVSGSWDGHRVALAAQTLAIEPGRLIGVTGPNGSGKSTLLAILARHLDPHTGRYRQGGTDVAELSLAQARRRLAVVDDEPHVFGSTVRENLRLAAPGCSDDAIRHALQRAGLREWYDALPRGLSTMLGGDRPDEDGASTGLSGGERARFGLARALLSGRGVLLLDEPVAHLDHATALAVMRDVAATAAGGDGYGDGYGAGYGAGDVVDGQPRTVVVVSHRPEGLDDADELIRLKHPTAPRRGAPAPAE